MRPTELQPRLSVRLNVVGSFLAYHARTQANVETAAATHLLSRSR